MSEEAGKTKMPVIKKDPLGHMHRWLGAEATMSSLDPSKPAEVAEIVTAKKSRPVMRRPSQPPPLESLTLTPAPPLSIAIQNFLAMMNSAGVAPITLENTVDAAPPPAHFQCINSLIYSPGVPVPDPSFLIGCECGPDGCGSSGKDSGRSCSCTVQGTENGPAYGADGRLGIESGPIYECNSQCSCPKTCPNRVIQRGRQIPLVIARYPHSKGWGVKAGQPIPAGTFIDLYLGEIITASEANHRFLRAAHDEGSYLFDLDFNYESGTESEFTVDAYHFGNVTHFINHSCVPNLRVHPCFIDSWDPRLHYLAFFASHHIAEGEELTFDYLGNVAVLNNSTKESRPTRLVCKCGASACRGFVY